MVINTAVMACHYNEDIMNLYLLILMYHGNISIMLIAHVLQLYSLCDLRNVQ